MNKYFYDNEMIKISEFTPAISSNKEHTNTANCKVIINNNTTDGKADIFPLGKETKKETTETYPTVNPLVEPSVPTYTMSDIVLSSEKDLFKHLAVSFSNILKTNNPKLIANLIDQSGKVILSGEDLAVAVSLALGIDVNLVRISFEDPEATCLGKVSPIKRVTAIKVNGYDFNLAYNKQYNTLSDEFGVSLTKCLIGI